MGEELLVSKSSIYNILQFGNMSGGIGVFMVE